MPQLNRGACATWQRTSPGAGVGIAQWVINRMNFLIKGRQQRTSAELARSICDACFRMGVEVTTDEVWRLSDVSSSSDSRRKLYDELFLLLQQGKLVLYGEGDRDPVPELVAQFAQEAYQHHMMEYLLTVMPRLEFEARKDITQIFVALLQRSIGSRHPTVEYVYSNPSIVSMTIRGYDMPSIALNTGMILHEMLQYEILAKLFLYSDDLYRFPQYIEFTSFSISCDAFKNLRDALVSHRSMAAEFLQQQYVQFFSMFTQLLDSQNYVTRRQSLKLLGELLVDRAHYSTMIRYVSDEENLKRIMNALRDRSKHIQLEAFHVFKVFVANPKKTPAVEAILRRNRSRILSFLEAFLPDSTNEAFIDERQYIIQIIRAMPNA